MFYETMFGRDIPKRCSNYKRIHHWHERISQLLLLESEIPQNEMLQIAEKLCDGSHSVINKDSVRAVLRSLGMQLYIEKWLQIIYRVTRIAPPIPGVLLINRLDDLFMLLQEPFDCYRVVKRKNFLNYNYVFCRLFQQLNCTQFSMFFPLIKSKTKLRQLDEMWAMMAKSLKWDIMPLASVVPFAVRLEKPEILLQRLASEYVPVVRAAPQIAPPKMVFRTLGRRSVERMTSQRVQLHSIQPEQASQKVAAGTKHRRSGMVKRPLLLNRRQCLVQRA